jgi:hypothetical protein
MPVPTSLSLVASLQSPLNPALIGGRQEEERPAASPAPVPAPISARAEPVETGPAVDFKEIVRANLEAAAQHAILGHEAPSFRECSRPSCRNASNLIPYPVVVEASVTETDLEEIFQRIVPAALEEAVSSPSPVRMAPEWQNEPAFTA